MPRKDRAVAPGPETFTSWISQRMSEASLAISAPHQLSWLAQPREALAPAMGRKGGTKASPAPKAQKNALAAALRNRGGATAVVVAEKVLEEKPEVKAKEDAKAEAPANINPESVPKAEKRDSGARRERRAARAAKRLSLGAGIESSDGKPPRAPGPLAPEYNTFGGIDSAINEVTASLSNWNMSGAGFVNQFDEFFRRGSGPPQASPRGSAQNRSAQDQQQTPGVTIASLQNRLELWSNFRLPADSARPRLLCFSCEARTEVQVVMSWHGVEILMKLNPSGVVQSFSEESQHGFGDFVTAWTECHWSSARSSIVSASTEAAGKPLETFLDLLSEAWDAEVSKAQEQSSNTAATDDGLEDSQIQAGTPSHHGESRGEEREEEFENEEEYSEEEYGMGSFEEFLSARPPLFRFEACGRGLAWDFPPSKQEKKELLLLQLFAQEGQQQAQIQALQASIPAGRLSRGSRASES
eukprot:TRINITY_DN65809_c0_g1_i1.p1 TRINITY_DN65809_c0_g1~~TRINITY_DN65809_c0_g1_i1.p1  ORF type:complete len:470 (+),score=116.13 TRINITY_DN65809_c0_g1_i1:88-1497(+)